MGIDPGVGRMGWGIIEERKGKFKAIDFGCFETKKETAAETRLFEIYRFVNKLVKRTKPEAAAVEELFFAANVKTALLVGQARGAIIVAITRNKIPVFSYTPLQIKQALTGYGRAEKRQIQIMVKSILTLPAIPAQDDAADALAVAITHGFSYKFKNRSHQ